MAEAAAAIASARGSAWAAPAMRWSSRKLFGVETIGATAAMGAVKALTEDGLFIGQRNPAFFDLMHDLAEDADEAQRGGDFV